MNRDKGKSSVQNEATTSTNGSGDPNRLTGRETSRSSRWSSNSKFNRILGNIERSILGQFGANNSGVDNAKRSDNPNKSNANKIATSAKRQQINSRRASTDSKITTTKTSIAHRNDEASPLREEKISESKVTKSASVSSLKASVSAKSTNEKMSKLTPSKCQQQLSTSLHPNHLFMTASTNRLSIPPPHANEEARSYNSILFSRNANNHATSGNNNKSTETAPLLGFDSSTTLSSYDTNQQTINATAVSIPMSGGDKQESYANSIGMRHDPSPATSARSLPTQSRTSINGSQQKQQQQTHESRLSFGEKTTTINDKDFDAEESGFSTYQSRRTLQAQSAHMYPQKYQQFNQNSTVTNEHNNETMLLPRQRSSNPSSTMMMDFGLATKNDLKHNNALIQHHLQQQQHQQQQQISLAFGNIQNQQGYLTTNLQQQHKNIVNNQMHQHTVGASNQVPIVRSNPGLTSQQYRDNIQNIQGQFATLGHNFNHQSLQQHHSFMPNLGQFGQHPMNLGQVATSTITNTNDTSGQQQIYANAPPKPRRYLYYDNTTAQNHHALSSQLAARLHPNSQHSSQNGPILPQGYAQSSYNLSHLGVPSLCRESQCLNQNSIHDANLVNQQSSFALSHQTTPQLIKSKSSIDANDLFRFRQNKQASIQQQQPIYDTRFSINHQINHSTQLRQQNLNNFHRPPPALPHNPPANRNLQRSKSVTHLLPEIDNCHSSDLLRSMQPHPTAYNQPTPGERGHQGNLTSMWSASTTHLNLLNQNRPSTLNRVPGIMKHTSSQQINHQMMPQNYSNQSVFPPSNQQHQLTFPSRQNYPQPTSNASSISDGMRQHQQSNSNSRLMAMPNLSHATVNPHNNALFSSLGGSGLIRHQQSHQSYNNLLVAHESNDFFNSKPSSSLDDKIRNLLIGNEDNAKLLDNQAAALSLNCANNTIRSAEGGDSGNGAALYQKVTNPNEVNIGNSNNNGGGMLSAPSPYSSSSHQQPMTQHPAAWTNTKFSQTAGSKQQQQSIITENSVNFLNKHASIKDESTNCQNIDSSGVDQFNNETTQKYVNSNSDGSQQIQDQKSVHQVLSNIGTSNGSKTIDMGNKQSRQVYQLDHQQHQLGTRAALFNQTMTGSFHQQDDTPNSQLIVDLTTPRVLAKTQTTLTATNSPKQSVDKRDAWFINQVGLPQMTLSNQKIESKSAKDGPDNGNFSNPLVGSNVEQPKTTTNQFSERTAPYYYSDLKSKEQQQALLEIAQQKSLSPPPKLLSRSTDQSSTRLALKSATMHLGHARTLGENLQHKQRLKQQQYESPQNKIASTHNYGNQFRLDSPNTSITIANNIDRLFESPVNTMMMPSKSMMTLNSSSINESEGSSVYLSGTDKSVIDHTAFATRKGIILGHNLNKSKSLENISRTLRDCGDKMTPVYENIRCSNKLMTAINNSTQLSSSSCVSEYNKKQLATQHDRKSNFSKASSNDSLDSILGSSLEDTDSNSDIIDEIEISSTDNHINDISELIEQLKTNHSKLTEEYKSTLVKISKTINSRSADKHRENKLARRLQMLELRSKKCESRSKNQLALIQMMENVLRQSSIRTSANPCNNIESTSNKQPSSNTATTCLSGSDSGQPTSFECDSSSAQTNSTSSSSDSKRYSSSSSSQDRLSSSPCLSLDLQNSCKQKNPSSHPDDGTSLIIEPAKIGDSNNNNKGKSCSNGNESAYKRSSDKSAKEDCDYSCKDTGPKQQIIRAIVTEAKNSQVEYVKSKLSVAKTFEKATTTKDDQKKITGNTARSQNELPDLTKEQEQVKKSNHIARRILDIEKRNQEEQRRTQRSKSIPSCGNSTDSSVSSSSNEDEARSGPSSDMKSSTNDSKVSESCMTNKKGNANRSNLNSKYSDDDFIEFLNSNAPSGQYSRFGASQFNASDFDSCSVIMANKRDVKTEINPKSESSARRSSNEQTKLANKSNGTAVKQGVGILKNSAGRCSNFMSANEPQQSSQSPSSLNDKIKLMHDSLSQDGPNSAKSSADLPNGDLLKRNEPSRRSNSSGISSSDQSSSKLNGSITDKFTTVLGNVIDVDVCPLVNNLSRCSPVNN